MSEGHEYKEKPDQTSSLEKGAVHDYVVQHNGDKYHFDAADLDRVQRKLKQRHVQMIAVSIPRPHPRSPFLVLTEARLHRSLVLSVPVFSWVPVVPSAVLAPPVLFSRTSSSAAAPTRPSVPSVR